MNAIYHQYHGCWWPVDIGSQGVSSHSIGLFICTIQYFYGKKSCMVRRVYPKINTMAADGLANKEPWHLQQWYWRGFLKDKSTPDRLKYNVTSFPVSPRKIIDWDFIPHSPSIRTRGRNGPLKGMPEDGEWHIDTHVEPELLVATKLKTCQFSACQSRKQCRYISNLAMFTGYYSKSLMVLFKEVHSNKSL